MRWKKSITNNWKLLVVIIAVIVTMICYSYYFHFEYITWTPVAGKLIELTDSFCVNGNQAVIFIRNSGTRPFNPATEISLVNVTTGAQITDSGLTGIDMWSYAEGSAIANPPGLAPGKITKLTVACTVGSLCKLRVMAISTGRTHTISVQC